MIIKVSIIIGPSVYNNHIRREVELEVADADVTDPQSIKQYLKIAQKQLKDSLNVINHTVMAKELWEKQQKDLIKKQLEADNDKENKAVYIYTNEIDELKKEIKKRDCRLDGIIASRNPDYVPPSENGEPIELS